MSMQQMFLAGGGATGIKYVDDLFATDLWTGNSTASKAITNGIDLTEGGMVWIKARDSYGQNPLNVDTVRGASKYISVANENTETTDTDRHPADGFTSTGFKVGTDTACNGNGVKYAGWTFRKHEGFFDVVTYDGTGSTQTISHSLGCKPGMIWVKSLDVATGTGSYWAVYHKAKGAHWYTKLDDPIQFYDNPAFWNDVEPTSTQFTVHESNAVNQSGKKYVAYLFADGDESAAQIFGKGGDEKIIKCGTYAGTGSDQDIDVGFEPQWLLIKNIDGNSNWYQFDPARGTSFGDFPDNINYVDNDNAETMTNGGAMTDGAIGFSSNGFMVTDAFGDLNQNGDDFIYVAIRRPMKPATEYTKEELFDPIQYTGDGDNTDGQVIETSIKRFSDGGMLWIKKHDTDSAVVMDSTAVGTLGGYTPIHDADDRQKIGAAGGRHHTQFYSEAPSGGAGSGFLIGKNSGDGDVTNTNSSYYGSWSFKRAPLFFDAFAFRSDGQSSQAVPHSLGVRPDFIIIGSLDKSYYGGQNLKMHYYVWPGTSLYSANHSKVYELDTNAAVADDSTVYHSTDPTATHFTVGSKMADANGEQQYWVYMWANLAGKCKIGNYTGNGGGTAINVDCGFSATARFVLIKTDAASAEYWNMFDTARGYGTSSTKGVYQPNVNSGFTDGSTTNTITEYASGFTIPSSCTSTALNYNNASHTYLAIA